MRQPFTVIAGGVTAAAGRTGDAAAPVTWRVDLRTASAVGAGEISAWRALLVRAGVADPIHADPDYLLPAAEHQAGGRELVFALAWADGSGHERLEAVVPLALPHSLWGRGRIVVWQPFGTAVAPTIAAGHEAAVHGALVARLGEARPRFALDLVTEPTSRATAPRLRAVSPRGGIPAHSLVGVRPVHAPSVATIEWISDPQRVPEAVEAFLALDAEVSAAPILGDPSAVAMVRRVTRLFAQRRQVTVALTRRAGAVVAASVTLGTGAQAVLWHHAAREPVVPRVERSA